MPSLARHICLTIFSLFLVCTAEHGTDISHGGAAQSPQQSSFVSNGNSLTPRPCLPPSSGRNNGTPIDNFAKAINKDLQETQKFLVGF